jgi:hypothetical protein
MVELEFQQCYSTGPASQPAENGWHPLTTYINKIYILSKSSMAALKDTLPQKIYTHILLPTLELLRFIYMKYVAHGEYSILQICYSTTTKPIQNQKRMGGYTVD